MLEGSARHQELKADPRENSDGSRSAMIPPPANMPLMNDRERAGPLHIPSRKVGSDLQNTGNDAGSYLCGRDERIHMHKVPALLAV